ncbi:hypothetical protein Aduo_004321 [Ancylostoma duodenale]
MEHVHSFLKRRRGGGDADLHKSISDAVKALSVVQLKQLRASIVVLGVSPADENELRQYSTGITEVFTGYLDQNLLMRTMSKVDQLFTRNECIVEGASYEGAFHEGPLYEGAYAASGRK